MLEETIIRESASSKMKNRVSVKGVGPPVTFATPKASKDDSSAAQATSLADQLSNEGLSDSTFDALSSQSP